MIIPVTGEALTQCLTLAPGRIGDDNIGRGKALEAWRKILGAPGTLAMYEPGDRADVPVRVFGCSAFVKDCFALAELAHPRPGLNARIVESVAKSQSVILDASAVAKANAANGLSVVILYANLAEKGLSEDEKFVAREQLSACFLKGHSGYRIERLLTETLDETDRAWVAGTKAWRFVAEFKGRGATGKQAPRALATFGREDARQIIGSIGSMLFAYREPRLRLAAKEQELLLGAIDGATDVELHERLGLSLAGVKKRWGSIFARVEMHAPDLFARLGTSSAGTRGRQRRHHLVAYLREHMEELRPYEAGD